jgi:hypothetical protein
MNPQDIAIGSLLFTTGAIFFARMRKRKEEAKWKFLLAYLVMLCGAMLAVCGLIFPGLVFRLPG